MQRPWLLGWGGHSGTGWSTTQGEHKSVCKCLGCSFEAGSLVQELPIVCLHTHITHYNITQHTWHHAPTIVVVLQLGHLVVCRLLAAGRQEDYRFCCLMSQITYNITHITHITHNTQTQTSKSMCKRPWLLGWHRHSGTGWSTTRGEHKSVCKCLGCSFDAGSLAQGLPIVWGNGVDVLDRRRSSIVIICAYEY